MIMPTIKTHESDESADGLGEICGICRRQISRYRCPSCNLSYCSLKCFRSESHSQCSEIFYRKEIEVGIKSDSSRTEGDRKRMIDLLRRVEDESADDNGLFRLSDEESEGESLASRFSAIDISIASADDLLRLLSKKERDKFFLGLNDPSSGLARELLESGELGETSQLPWWDAPSIGRQSSFLQRNTYGVKPDLMEVPINLINQASRGVSLLYNICAVLLAYAYITRHLAISPLSSTTNDTQNRREARKIFSQTASFLIDRKSKLLLTSLTDAVVSFWSRLDQDGVNNKTIRLLLEDVAKFVRPQWVTNLSGERACTTALAANHPSAAAIAVISDISSLFSGHMDSSIAVHRRSHIEMKLLFYAAHILSTPSSNLHALADEVLLLSKKVG